MDSTRRSRQCRPGSTTPRQPDEERPLVIVGADAEAVPVAHDIKLIIEFHRAEVISDNSRTITKLFREYPEKFAPLISIPVTRCPASLMAATVLP
jgi:hypothetical protein